MKKILLVDDDPDLLVVLRAALSRAGYEVACAADGEEALEKVRSELPDLIVLDLMMPKLDGYSVHRKLKEDPRTAGIPVVVLTAYGNLEEFVQVRKDLRIAAYLEKPVSMAKFMETLSKVLERPG